MSLSYAVYALVFVEALGLSWLLTRLAISVAPRLGFLDQPGHRKVHVAPKPLLGGAAIYLAFNAVVLVNLGLLMLLPLVVKDIPQDSASPLARVVAQALDYRDGVATRAWALTGFLLGGLVVFVVGLIDDKHGMSPAFKLAGQGVAALILFGCGVRIDTGTELGGMMLQMATQLVLTVGWVVLLSNSFNLLDNMDGLSAGVAVIALSFFAVIAQMMERQTFMVLALVTLGGSILGFLRYNFHPSRIFMGDAGSLFIGYSVSSLTVLSTYFIPTQTETRLALLVPLVVMAVPLFDTISVVMIRLRNGKPIFQGDKNHFSHRLVVLGFSQRNAVLMIYLVTICTGLAAIVMPELPFSHGMLLLVQVVVVFCIISLLENAKR